MGVGGGAEHWVWVTGRPGVLGMEVGRLKGALSSNPITLAITVGDLGT